MIVADGEDCAIGLYGFTEDEADVDGRLRNPTFRDAHFLDEAIVLVQQQRLELLYVEVLHHRPHVVVDAGGCAQVWPFFRSLGLSTLA